MSVEDEDNYIPTEDDLQQAAEVSENLTNEMLRGMINEERESKLKLLLHIKELKEKLDIQKKDQADIYFFLNKKCEDSYEIIGTLEEQILHEQDDREASEKFFENKIEELKAKIIYDEGKLSGRIHELEDQLTSIMEFKSKKEETENELRKLMVTLNLERSQFKSNADEMERKFLLERDRLGKDYEKKIETFNLSLDIRVNDEISTKTKKTLLNNSMIKKELTYQSKKADQVLEMDKMLVLKDREMRCNLEISQSMEKEMEKRLSMYQKVVKQLNDQIETLKRGILIQESTSLSLLQEKDIEIETLRNELYKAVEIYKTENSQIDEMWLFLSTSYTKTKKKNIRIMNHKKENVNISLNQDSTESSNNNNKNKNVLDHENILLDLVRLVIKKYPYKFHDILLSEANDLNNNASQLQESGLIDLEKSAHSIAQFLPPISPLFSRKVGPAIDNKQLVNSVNMDQQSVTSDLNSVSVAESSIQGLEVQSLTGFKSDKLSIAEVQSHSGVYNHSKQPNSNKTKKNRSHNHRIKVVEPVTDNNQKKNNIMAGIISSNPSRNKIQEMEIPLNKKNKKVKNCDVINFGVNISQLQIKSNKKGANDSKMAYDSADDLSLSDMSSVVSSVTTFSPRP
jgi:hypothetical protein